MTLRNLNRYQKYKESYKGYYLTHRDTILEQERKWREEHSTYFKEWQKKHPHYSRDRHRKDSSYQKQYMEQYRKKHPEKQREYVQRNPEKVKAHHIVSNRKIPLGKQCVFCGTSDRLERHHPDYSRPTVAQTLCERCHASLHSEMEFLGKLKP